MRARSTMLYQCTKKIIRPHYIHTTNEIKHNHFLITHQLKRNNDHQNHGNSGMPSLSESWLRKISITNGFVFQILICKSLTWNLKLCSPTGTTLNTSVRLPIAVRNS